MATTKRKAKKTTAVRPDAELRRLIQSCRDNGACGDVERFLKMPDVETAIRRATVEELIWLIRHFSNDDPSFHYRYCYGFLDGFLVSGVKNPSLKAANYIRRNMPDWINNAIENACS